MGIFSADSIWFKTAPQTSWEINNHIFKIPKDGFPPHLEFSLQFPYLRYHNK